MTQSSDDRITKLEANQTNMGDAIKEMKEDIKGIKTDVTEIKLTIAKWSGAIIVATSMIQVALNKFL